MTLEELNLEEIRLFSELNTDGFIDEKIEQLQKGGIFEAYKKVFTEYTNLINSKNEGNEALKRAVFLKWYESAEPSFLSGINDLPENISIEVFQNLHSKIESKELDYEFQWMLHFYIQIADFAFSKYIDINKLPLIENKEIWENVDFDTSQFNNRGQMRIYWIAVIESNKERLRFEKRKNDRKNSAK